jgi:hypothetical protein
MKGGPTFRFNREAAGATWPVLREPPWSRPLPLLQPGQEGITPADRGGGGEVRARI